MVSSFLTPTDYAYYQLGAYTIPFIAIITGSVISVLIPTFSELYYKNRILEINLLLKDSIVKTSKFLIPILVYCVFFGEYIITSFYSDTFHISGKVFQLYCCIFFLSVVSFMAILNAVGKQNWVLFISIFNLIINLVLNIFLIPIYGIYGAVYSTIFTVYIGYLVPIILIKKFLNLSFFEYFPKRKYFKILVLSIIFALPFFLIFEYLIFNKFFVFIFSIPYYLLVLFIFDPMLFSKNNFVRIFNNED